MKNKNIIALSGKKQSGKNTVADIIQYLTSPLDIQKTSFGDFKRYFGKKRGFESNYQQKSFAGKLKQIVSLLTGVSVEDLEKEEVKNSTLPEEWWYYTNSLFNVLEDKELIPYLKAPLYIQNSTKWYIIKPTYREILQQLGTNLLRDQLHPDVHINALFADYKESKPPKGETFEYMHSECVDCKKQFNGYKRQFICNNCHDTHNWFPKWILTDPRFPNEIEKVKEHNGITIRIERTTELRFPELYDGFKNQKIITNWQDYLRYMNKFDIIYHKSETALDGYTDFDYIIHNDYDLDSLIEEVRKILTKENII